MTRSVPRQADERRTAAEKGIVVAAPSGRDAGTVPAVTRGATLPFIQEKHFVLAHMTEQRLIRFEAAGINAAAEIRPRGGAWVGHGYSSAS